MERIETTILRNLIYNEEFSRKVIPFIEPDYFEQRSEKVIFEEITKFIVKYGSAITIEEFRSKALKAVDIYQKKSEEERKPCMFVLDSLGMLSTEKEIRDALDDKQVRDMTKSQLVKGAFRMLTLKLGQTNIPLIVTNHTYDVIGSYVPTKEMGGGSGLKYAASTIVYLSKKKEKDGKEVIGNIIKAKTHKSRLSKENKEVELSLIHI